MVDRKEDFNNNFEKLISAEATVTGIVNKILYAMIVLGKKIHAFQKS